MFLLSGQFKTNKHKQQTRITQEKIPCEGQATRLPCPGHTTSSVHLLTEDRERLQIAFRMDGDHWAPLGKDSGRKWRMPYLYQASDLDLHSQKGQDYCILSCWPNIIAGLLETQPGESCRIPSYKRRFLPVCPCGCFQLALIICFKGKHREHRISVYT